MRILNKCNIIHSLPYKMKDKKNEALTNIRWFLREEKQNWDIILTDPCSCPSAALTTPFSMYSCGVVGSKSLIRLYASATSSIRELVTCHR